MITLHARLEKRPKPQARKTAQGWVQESTSAGEPLLEFRTTSIWASTRHVGAPGSRAYTKASGLENPWTKVRPGDVGSSRCLRS